MPKTTDTPTIDSELRRINVELDALKRRENVLLDYRSKLRECEKHGLPLEEAGKAPEMNSE
jgi:hypothetical protein